MERVQNKTVEFSENTERKTYGCFCNPLGKKNCPRQGIKLRRRGESGVRNLTKIKKDR